jgi:hypothetical protein
VYLCGATTWPDTSVRELGMHLRDRKFDPKCSPEDAIRSLTSFELYLNSLNCEFLPSELCDIIFSVEPIARNAEIAISYFGLRDGKSLTLQAVGEKLSITRERIRQICAKIESRLSGKRPFAPRLLRAIEILKDNAPASRGSLEKALVDQHVILSTFRLEGIFRAAELFGLEKHIDWEPIRSACLTPRSKVQFSERHTNH